MNHLLTATLLLFLLWPAYALLLRYSDRYALNRFLLLLAMLAVCALPFVSLPSPAPLATKGVRGTVSFLEESVRPNVASLPGESLVSTNEFGAAPAMEKVAEAPPTITLPLIYGIGVGLMLLVLGVRLLLILALHLRSRPNEDGTYRLLHPGATPGQAFTFCHKLYFSEDVPQDADFQHILDHERVHARQGHTLDILLSEVFLCLFWFHPAAWWLRNRMRANLEYLVDKAVVSGGADRRSYQLALVRQSQGAYGLALALPFSEPTLKSRIARMTGLPEYRVVALLAAVALVFWLVVTILIINGTVFGDEPPVGKEYLEAAAHPGDPYYDYYQETLPEELTSLEIYTSRMVTVDEYLQLRAILGKAPGAKLFVYKNRFDEGYSLELRYGSSDRAFAHRLNPESLEGNTSFLGLKYGNKSNQGEPALMGLQADLSVNSGSPEDMVFYFTDAQKGPALDFFRRRMGELNGDLQVYVNREKTALLEHLDNDQPSVKLNGTEIAAFGADDWPKITVEGRTQLDPKKRLRLLLGLSATPQQPESTSFQSVRQKEGTYRKWYEGFGFLKGQFILAQYNDRQVPLDFLLDTEFGEKAIITHGINFETNMGEYALQVIDDDPNLEINPPIRPSQKNMDPEVFKTDANKVNLFFRRLPTPMEVAHIRTYLANFPDFDLRVFQDCKNDAGVYTLYFGNASGTKSVSLDMAAGEAYKDPVRLSLSIDDLVPTLYRYRSAPKPGPRKLLSSGAYLLIGGKYIEFHGHPEPYGETSLDLAPDATALKCKLSGIRYSSASGFNFWSNLNPSFWMYTYRAAHPGMLDGFQALLEEKGYNDRIPFCYINDRVVTYEEFDQYQGGEGAYVRMGTWSNVEEAPVILEIVD